MADTPTKRTDKRTETHGVCLDVISRQAAIDRINKQREHLEPNIFPQDKIGDAAYRICAEFIERLPSAQQWIPIEDRPPEFGKDVLISHRGFVSIDWLTQSEGDAYFFASGVAIADIDAWCPLPEPFREGGAEECH